MFRCVSLSAVVETCVAFLRERRGQVAITFGLSAIPAVVVVGSAVDYSRAVQQRSNLQQASDATALAIAHTYLTKTSTSSSLSGPTQKYLSGVMNTVAPSTSTVTVGGFTGTPGAATLQSITLSNNNTRMCIATALIVNTQMVGIIGVNNMKVGTTSCADVGGTYEIAMVLDNSYSMSESLGSQTKMDALHDAAEALVDVMIPDGTTTPTSAISLVPFNALVNVGTSRTASFLDTTGASSLNWRVIQKPLWVTTPSRLTLFDSIYTDSTKKKTVAWGGCVEDRPNNQYSSLGNDSTNYLTTDTAATTGDSLFVPYFAPDDPGNVNASSPDSTYTYYYENFTDKTINSSSNTVYKFLNSYISDSGYKDNDVGSCTGSDSYSTADAKATNIYPKSGMTMACKYKGAVMPSASLQRQWFNLSNGPNESCSTPAITPLTTNKTTLKTQIEAMDPEGLTNLATGFMWGWRTISPVFNPFPITSPPVIGQQNPKAYNFGPPSNKKVIILMTDGFATWSPMIFPASYGLGTMGLNNLYKSAYESYGFQAENRLANYSTTCPATGSSTANTGSGFVSSWNSFRCQMDNVLLEGCTNAKNAGVTIYTVGFSTSQSPIDQEGINVLKGCATSASFYYQAADGAAITSAFKQIAASIANLRLSN